MPRIWTWVLGLVCWSVGLAIAGAAHAVPPSSETLFPDTTRGFVSAPNAKRLTEQFNKTQLGQLLKDPAMVDFTSDLRRQFEERWSNVQERLGLNLNDLRGVPAGEFAVGMVQLGRDRAGMAMLCDVTGRRQQATALLQKVTAHLMAAGAKKRTVEVAGASVLVFDLPRAQYANVELPSQSAFWVHRDHMLVACDDQGTMEGILRRLSGKKGGALADVDSFQAVMKRCQKDEGKATPQLRWYLQPLGYMEIIRALRGERVRRKGMSLIDVFKSQGFTAIQGVGGFIDFHVGNLQFVHRTAIWAPPPWALSMKMLEFLKSKDFTPEPWVPSTVASYATVYFNMLNAFDHLGPLFDDLVGRGDKGIWQETLRGLNNPDDPDSPHIDLRNELMVYLGNRISMITEYKVPITTTSERMLLAIEIKGGIDGEKAVAVALTKIFKNDSEMRQRKLGNYVVWESVPEEKAAVPEVKLELPNLNNPGEPAQAPVPQGRSNALFPNAAFTAAAGRLFIASNFDFLEKILRAPNLRNTLAGSVEYRMVQRTMRKVDGSMASLRTFGRTDEQARPNYELIRQGKMPESETMLGRLLNTAFGAGKKGVVRKQRINPRKMPDFEFVRRYLGPAGMQMTTEADGWFLKGFMLAK